MAHAVCIYNPASRNAPQPRVIKELASQCIKHGYSVEFQPTKHPLHGMELARNAARSGVDLVIACGGDGTIHEVAGGLALSSVPLAILPAGTANVLARELQLPRHPLKAIDSIPKLKPRPIALGKCGDRYFALMAGAGLDAAIIGRVSSSSKARLGRLAFGMAGLRHWLSGCFPPLAVSVDGKSFDCTFAVISRVARYGGSFRITPSASLFDDSFEVCLFRGTSRPAYLKYLSGVVTGTHPRFRDVVCIRCKNIEISSEQPVPIQLDGELHGFTPVSLTLIPNALTLLCP